MKLFWMNMPGPLERAIKACKWHFLTAAFFSALVNILFLAPTIYMMQVYDRVVPTGGLLTLFWLTVVVAFAIGTLALLDVARTRAMMRASLRLNRLMAGDILDRLMARRKLTPGQPSTAQAMREFDQLRQALGGPAAIALFDIPWIPLYFFVAFMIHPLLGCLILAGGAVLIVLALFNENNTKKRSQQGLQAAAAAYASQDAVLSKAEIVRALGMRRALVARQLDQRAEGLSAGASSQFASGNYTAMVKFVRMVLQSLALGAGAWLAVKGQISVGAIIAASVLLSRALQPIEQLVGVWPTIGQARQAITTLKALFDGSEGPELKPMLLPAPEGHVEINNISVRNPEGTILLLRNVSFRLTPGEVVGLVGPSGAGKTTLARVVAGALAPDGGEVRIDEANFTDWDPEEIARHIGYLPQDSALLPGTIGENISRFAVARGADPADTDYKVIRAAILAGVHDLIQHMPSGYNARVGDTGPGISGGQAQRIALARALFDDPKVLIFDEPSSALDAEGEAALMHAVEAAKQRGAAIMIVAHRSSVLSNADRLVVLNNGAVERQGTRQQVLTALRTAAAGPNVVSMKEGR